MESTCRFYNAKRAGPMQPSFAESVPEVFLLLQLAGNSIECMVIRLACGGGGAWTLPA